MVSLEEEGMDCKVSTAQVQEKYVWDEHVKRFNKMRDRLEGVCVYSLLAVIPRSQIPREQ